MNLPESFKNRMKYILQDDYESFIQSYNIQPLGSLRLNPLKNMDFIKKDFTQSIPWAANGYYYNKDQQPGKSIYHDMGLYYIQESSAMFPVEVLNPTENDVVLDTVEATVVLADSFYEQDDYYFADLVISTMYDLQYWVYAIALLSLILAIVCFVFLMCASGRRKGLPDDACAGGGVRQRSVEYVGHGCGAALPLRSGSDAHRRGRIGVGGCAGET